MYLITYGFSAGSQTGFLVYRILLSKNRLLGLKFEKAAFCSMAMHPSYFYDMTTCLRYIASRIIK